jgi:hypothetical protein
VENPDILDTVNTVLKMAKKRAKIDAVIGVTRSSGLFTQDMEDLPPAPAAPEPAIVTEAKTFTRPAALTETVGGKAAAVQDSGGTKAPSFSGKGTPEAPNGSEHTEPTPPEQEFADPPPALVEALAKKLSPPDATIDLPKQRNLHRAFKDAIPATVSESTRKSAEVIFREWLKHEGFTGSDGQGSTKGIPDLLFAEIKDKAIKFAGTLR